MSDKLRSKIGGLDWAGIRDSLHRDGFVIVPGVLSSVECAAMIEMYDDPAFYRKTVDMHRYRFGSGEYKYFRYPLPGVVGLLRESIYPEIVPVANRWMEESGPGVRFPLRHEELRARCAAAGQELPTALILRYGPGGFNTLHQDLYGEVFFPMQALFVLNEEGRDFTGGEFVITEQIPRAQSKANVLRPGLGDMVIFTTNFRPVKGSKGFYRVSMRHGVSPLHSGVRHAMGIIFHDASQ